MHCLCMHVCVCDSVFVCVCVYCVHAHALQLLTDKIKGKSNRLIAPVCLPSVPPFSLSFTPPPLTVPTLNAATVNEIVSSGFASSAPTRLIVARLVSSAVVHWRNSWWSDFMASNANCAHAPPSLFLLLLLFFLPPSLSRSVAYSYCIGFVCCSYLCADFAAAFCLIFFFFSFFCVCKAQKPKSLRNIARD